MKNWTDDKLTNDFGQKLEGVTVCMYHDAWNTAQRAYRICERSD
jgi:hypothetical protein